MDLIKRVKERNKRREQERKEAKQKAEIFKKPVKVYAPSSKRFNIIMLIIFAAVLGYFIFTSEVLMKDSCGIMQGIECTDISITSSQISFVAHNYLKEEMNVTIRLEGCEETASNTMKPNTKATYTFTCSNTEKAVKKDMYITHVGYSGLPHDKIGKITGNVE